MATVPFTFDGMLYDKLSRTQRNVFMQGQAHITDLGVGGGPMPPGQQPGQPPLGIWGPPTVGHHPDHGLPMPQPPGGGAGGPPVIWPSPPGGIPPVGGYPGFPAPPDQIWPGPGPLPGVSNPMVPPTQAIFVVGYAPGYGATWVKLAPIGEQLPEPPGGQPPSGSDGAHIDNTLPGAQPPAGSTPPPPGTPAHPIQPTTPQPKK